MPYIIDRANAAMEINFRQFSFSITIQSITTASLYLYEIRQFVTGSTDGVFGILMPPVAL